MTEMKRPHKIVITGGRIAKELLRELTEHGLADEVVWIEGKERPENPRPENYDQVQEAFMRSIDHANLAYAATHENCRPTTQFRRVVTDNPEGLLKDADIVIVTTGAARKRIKEGPNAGKFEPRSKLLETNSQLLDPIAKVAAQEAPNATYIVATNPVDTITQRFQETSGLPADQIVGLSGELDRTRLIQNLCEHLRVPPQDIRGANVIGQHGEQMIPTIQTIQVKQPDGSWKPFSEYPNDIINSVREKTVGGGAEFVKKAGVSDNIGPAAAIVKMATEIAHARSGRSSTPLYVSAMGDEGVYIGRPVQFDASGTYKTLPLPEHAPALWEKSLAECRSALADLPGRGAAVRAVV